MKESLTKLYTKLGYTFSDKKTLQLALAHRSYAKTSNERLEFLGDSLLNFIIADALFHEYTDVEEGELSRLRANLVNGDILAEIAKELDIGEYLLLGVGEKKSGGANRNSILADAVEAIIGAIYLDSDIETCRKSVLKWYTARLQNIDIVSGKDSKTKLQELLQASKLPLPDYTVVKVEGEAHAQTFYIECNVPGLNYVTQGVGTSKRKAEQLAAELFLEKFKNESK
jgi:ribonuclease-3